jgi:hypothetical protein
MGRSNASKLDNQQVDQIYDGAIERINTRREIIKK